MSTSDNLSETKQAKAERQRARKRYGPLFDEVVVILFNHDPISINFGSNTDEYEPEAESILQRIGAARTADELRRIVHEEFVRWFNEAIAGSEPKYSAIAQDIWAAWQRNRA